MMTKIDYIEGTLVQLDLWGEQFANLEERASRAETERREDLQQELAQLERRRRTLRRQLRKASRGPTPGWEELRRDLEDELGEFRSRAIQVYDDVLEVRS